MYRRIDKGMKKTIAIAVVAVVSFALLAGCGSKADPPAKSPDSSSTPTTATTEPQDEQATVAKAASDFYANLATESEEFVDGNDKQEISYAALDEAFPKSFSAVDVPSFKTKKHAYTAVYFEGLLLHADPTSSESPKTSVSDLFTIKDTSEIKITGDKATFKTTAFPGLSTIEPVEQITFNKVDGKWLLDGAKYTDAHFKVQGFPTSDELLIK